MRPWLRLEGLAMLVVCVAVYAHAGAPWWVFAVLFLAPDLSFIGYAVGPRAGMWAYNLMHSEVGPAILALTGLWLIPALLPIALIWGAHIGLDRMLGYGLKTGLDFSQTHLGPIGRVKGRARTVA